MWSALRDFTCFVQQALRNLFWKDKVQSRSVFSEILPFTVLFWIWAIFQLLMLVTSPLSVEKNRAKCSNFPALWTGVCKLPCSSQVQIQNGFGILDSLVLFFSALLIFIYFMCTPVSEKLCMYHVCVGVRGGRKKGSGSLELKLQVVVSPLMWVLGMEPRSSGTCS